MIGCTFKPKINSDYKSKEEEGSSVHDRTHRFDKLYKMGLEIITSRKDKPRDVLELELYGKECTFKPNISKNSPISSEETKFHNDIYHEKSYELLYSRLKNGRIQKIIRESVNERGEFPPELQEYCN